MQLYELTTLLEGDISQITEDCTVIGVTSDSRAVQPGFVFVAIAGTQVDGAKFVPSAIEKGAVLIVCNEESALDNLSVPILRVNDARQALSQMAASFYGNQPETIIAITGTNGKTSIASFVRQIWQATGHEAASLGTVGVVTPKREIKLAHTTPDPVQLHQILADISNEGVTHLAVEASSHGLAQYRLDGLNLKAGAFINISRDHLDYHDGFEDYFNAKMRLFLELLPPNAPSVIYADTDRADDVMERVRSVNGQVFSVGAHGEHLKLVSRIPEGLGQNMTLEYEDKSYQVLLPLAGEFQVANALVSAGLCIVTGSPADQVIAALAHLQGAKGRLEKIGEKPNGASVFIDYAHTPDALQNVLETLRPVTKGKLHVVFGCGGDRDKGKRPEMGQAAGQTADIIYVTDDNPRSEEPAQIRKEILVAVPDAVEIGNRAEAIKYAADQLGKGDVLLVAGKGHETGQIVGGEVIPFSDHEEVAKALNLANLA